MIRVRAGRVRSLENVVGEGGGCRVCSWGKMICYGLMVWRVGVFGWYDLCSIVGFLGSDCVSASILKSWDI